MPQYLNLTYTLCCSSAENMFSLFLNDHPLVLSHEILSQEVPYLGGTASMNFYVEGLRFPDKDFDGLITINLSLLEPVSSVSPLTWNPQFPRLKFISILCLFISYLSLFSSFSFTCDSVSCVVGVLM